MKTLVKDAKITNLLQITLTKILEKRYEKRNFFFLNISFH